MLCFTLHCFVCVCVYECAVCKARQHVSVLNVFVHMMTTRLLTQRVSVHQLSLLPTLVHGDIAGIFVWSNDWITSSLMAAAVSECCVLVFLSVHVCTCSCSIRTRASFNQQHEDIFGKRWHLAAHRSFKGLFEVSDLVLRVRLELDQGYRVRHLVVMLKVRLRG